MSDVLSNPEFSGEKSLQSAFERAKKTLATAATLDNIAENISDRVQASSNRPIFNGDKNAYVRDASRILNRFFDLPVGYADCSLSGRDTLHGYVKGEADTLSEFTLSVNEITELRPLISASPDLATFPDVKALEIAIIEKFKEFGVSVIFSSPLSLGSLESTKRVMDLYNQMEDEVAAAS